VAVYLCGRLWAAARVGRGWGGRRVVMEGGGGRSR